MLLALPAKSRCSVLSEPLSEECLAVAQQAALLVEVAIA